MGVGRLQNRHQRFSRASHQSVIGTSLRSEHTISLPAGLHTFSVSCRRNDFYINFFFNLKYFPKNNFFSFRSARSVSQLTCWLNLPSPPSVERYETFTKRYVFFFFNLNYFFKRIRFFTFLRLLFRLFDISETRQWLTGYYRRRRKAATKRVVAVTVTLLSCWCDGVAFHWKLLVRSDVLYFLVYTYF